MRLRPALRAFALGLSLASLAPLAAAQSAQDRATARSAAEEADKKLAAKDLDGALDMFSKADALVPAPTLKLQIGRIQMQKGKLVEAQQTLIDASRSAPVPNEPASWAKAREQAGKEANDLKARVPAVEIVVEPRDKSPKVTVDGEPVNAAALGVPRPTNPGQHTIRAEAEGFQPAETTIVLKEGDRTQVVLRLAASGAVAGAVPPPTTDAPKPATADKPAGEPAPAAAAAEGTGQAHSGFFFRVGLGAAFHKSTVDSKFSGVRAWKLDASGTGAAFDLQLGGAVARGLIIAGDLGAQAITDPSVSNFSTDLQNVGAPSSPAKGSLTFARLGAIAVWYPSPTGGFHLFGGGAFGRAQFTNTDDTLSQATKDIYSFTATGLALNVGAGYEFRVGGKSSVGVLLRLDYANLSGSDSVSIPSGGTAPAQGVSFDRSFTMTTPSILVNYTYN